MKTIKVTNAIYCTIYKTRIICSNETGDSFMNVSSLYSNCGYVECACGTLAKCTLGSVPLCAWLLDASPLSAWWQWMP